MAASSYNKTPDLQYYLKSTLMKLVFINFTILWFVLPYICTSYVILRAVWYHLYNLKNVKNTHGEVTLLEKLQASACNFPASITPPWVLFPFFKLKNWYQITQNFNITVFHVLLKNTTSIRKMLGTFRLARFIRIWFQRVTIIS